MRLIQRKLGIHIKSRSEEYFPFVKLAQLTLPILNTTNYWGSRFFLDFTHSFETRFNVFECSDIWLSWNDKWIADRNSLPDHANGMTKSYVAGFCVDTVKKCFQISSNVFPVDSVSFMGFDRRNGGVKRYIDAKQLWWSFSIANDIRSKFFR